MIVNGNEKSLFENVCMNTHPSRAHTHTCTHTHAYANEHPDAQAGTRGHTHTHAYVQQNQWRHLYWVCRLTLSCSLSPPPLSLSLSLSILPPSLLLFLCLLFSPSPILWWIGDTLSSFLLFAVLRTHCSLMESWAEGWGWCSYRGLQTKEAGSFDKLFTQTSKTSDWENHKKILCGAGGCELWGHL